MIDHEAKNTVSAKMKMIDHEAKNTVSAKIKMQKAFISTKIIAVTQKSCLLETR